MSTIKLALIQMRSGTDPERNIDDASAMIREAAAEGARLVLTPETTNLVQRDAARLQATLNAPDEAPSMVRFADLADALNIDLVIGSLALRGKDGRAVNRQVVFGPDGAVKATYDKIHMFDVQLGAGEAYRESDQYAPGSEARLVDAAGARLGLTICYDVRFPHLYRRLAQAGATVIDVPSAFTKVTGRATGRFCCAPAPSRRAASSWPRPRAACTRTGARPGAGPWWSDRGARSSRPSTMTSPACSTLKLIRTTR